MIGGMKWILSLLAVLAFLPERGAAQISYGTAITTVPYNITKAGVYRFTKDLGYTGLTKYAIGVEATDVVIDLNGYELVAVSGTTNVATGIQCPENRVTIKNGSIRGFLNGVVVTADYSRVTGLLVANCLASGISVLGNHSEISHNRVSQTGGSGNNGLYSIGIALTGTNGTVNDNDVQTTFQTDTNGHYSDGIRIRGCQNVIVSNNRVTDTEPLTPTKATSTGIATDPAIPSGGLVYLGNTVIAASTAFDLSGGVSGKYGDNITSNFTTTDYFTTGTGMVSIGNNN